MYDPTKRRPLLALALAAALIGLLATDADAGKKKKKDKKKPKETVTAPQPAADSKPEAAGLAPAPSVVEKANRHLLAYETAAARELLAGEGAASSDAWVATTRGWILEQEGDYEAAAVESRRAADLDPRNPAPVLRLGESLAYAQKSAEAVDAYAQAEARARGLLAAREDDLDGLYYLGVAQQGQKRFEESAATLERARELAPADTRVLYQLGVTSFYRQSWSKAFDALSSALEKNSGLALAYYYRGLAAGKLDRKDVLYNDLDRFVKMAPDAPEAANARQILGSFG